ncbi:hypothetical protein FQN53_002578 [Emmonsiellopsis sp. PD_33]|nr:hypothetical protein FQN53_002578 [Emmonsiellopsis sp. PD_33]
MPTILTSAPLLGALSGASLHIIAYRVGEWDTSGLSLFVWYSIATFIATVHTQLALSLGLLPSTWPLEFTIAHIAAIYASMLLYRACFHCLHKFPGPFLARLSNVYGMMLSAKNRQYYDELQKLHQQYGDYVRIGPNELSITDPGAVQAIYSGRAKVSKGPWYDIMLPKVTLHTERDKKEHARRRKVWDMALSSKAVRSYEPCVRKHINQLVNRIDGMLDNPMDITEWFNYFSLDLMGSMGFGRSFNMVADGKEPFVLKMFRMHASNVVELLGHLPWVFPFLKIIERMNKTAGQFWKWIGGRARERIADNPESPDVFSYLLKAYHEGPQTPKHELDLHADAFLVVIAGSDTTASTLIHLFSHIAADRSLLTQLQTELDQFSELSYDKICSIILLDAVINETLRLHPVVPSGTQRLTPPEGIRIGDRYIPGNVIVKMPSHAMFRDKRNFHQPNEFIPERWTTRPELVKNASVFIPFNGGPYACAGKQLAMMELRLVTAELLRRFDVELAPEQDIGEFWGGGKDAFTLASAPLRVIFRRRVCGR